MAKAKLLGKILAVVALIGLGYCAGDTTKEDVRQGLVSMAETLEEKPVKKVAVKKRAKKMGSLEVSRF